jgi:hypothetical protein
MALPGLRVEATTDCALWSEGREVVWYERQGMWGGGGEGRQLWSESCGLAKELIWYIQYLPTPYITCNTTGTLLQSVRLRAT